MPAAPTADDAGMMEMANAVLEEVWGFPGFRGVQGSVIRRLLVDNKSALCLMPTGGGKSLCYQVPAICFPGLTLVVSPLIALMKDQVDALRALNVRAASMDSSLSMEEMDAVRRSIKDKTLKLLYVAPERLNNENFVQLISDQDIDLLAVDESHCISEWGPSFRPDYLKVARFAKELGAKRVLALTATATPSVAKDICTRFEIDFEEGLFQTGNYRANLELQIKPTYNVTSKLAVLAPFLKSRKGGAAIMYATTQANTEEVAALLKTKGIESKVYHAGLPAETRKEVQNWFLAGEGVVCATIAFGMGIDKANIRQVVHWHMPKTMENYSQEIGRAGRDGLPSTCLMIPSSSDLPILESFARSNTPSRNSIRDWLLEVFAASPAADGSLDFSLYEQANKFDITSNTLGLLYAQLELQNELLRAVTPFYATYTLKPSDKNPRGWAKVFSGDKSPAADAIRKHWTKGSTWWTLDSVAAGITSGIDRAELAKQITRWEAEGLLTSKVTGVRSRFQPLKELPTSESEIEALADTLFGQMRDREEADVKRLIEVAAFISGSQCFAYGLASYFGDSSVPNGACGNCSFCKSKTPITFNPDIALLPDEKSIQALLNVVGVRDDSRFLARVAFGVSSPRATQLGLSRNPVFGSCSKADFGALVARFEKECAAAGWVNKGILAPPKAAPAKRSGAAAGGAAKRARK